MEIATQWQRAQSTRDDEDEVSLHAVYGLTGNWSAGVEVPYQDRRGGGQRERGIGDLVLTTKYRFWRRDTLGAQSSAAVLLAVKPDTSQGRGPSATDVTTGLTWGYESRRWYRWASVRYRFNGEDDRGADRGDRLLVDLVAGIRLKPTGYLEPDTVWMVELNGERTWRSEGTGGRSGGTGLFVSPGVFWTYRNFAVKAGIQLPVYQSLNDPAQEADLRSRLILEWHF